MKPVFLFFFSFLFFAIASSQTLPSLIKNINTAEQAWSFLDIHPKYKGEVVSFKSIQDSSAFAKKLYQTKRGTILTNNGYVYKLLWDTTCQFSKVSYVFLSGDSLTIQQIDGLRTSIIDQYNHGTPFNQLSSIYTMDGNTNGELDWFYQGYVANEFAEAINQHAKGEVFTVDVPSHNWYYVVKKTHDTQWCKEVVVLKIKGK